MQRDGSDDTRRGRPTAVTRADVARHVGTSTAVVSYVINNGPRPVAAETREKVLRAIAELGYRPNRLAQALRGQRSHVIGLVLPDISNPFYAELARVIEAVADARGYSLILCNTRQDSAREIAYIRALVDRRVDGVLLISGSTSHELQALAREMEVPAVLLDRSVNYSGDISLVATDNLTGGRIATEHLIGLGHRRVVALTGPARLGNSRARGYETAMREADLAPELHHSAEFDFESTYALAMTLLSEAPPTAIFAGNDIAALSVLRAAADLRIAMPGELAVVGYDNIKEAAFSIPRLTTMDHPIDTLGAVAVEVLLERMDAAADASAPMRLVTPRLVVRESCGAAR
ncbi:LacI family DNA-binding transcriptional regulator [Acuticoccus mangrovi]|uniref:LacI family DNA-binding transcriptional regulator n=1 Tax=Acuticoccus mangrovi TaxID=2796142 RepID=A0A934IGP3_9HYPH|nr:LacI family DNA-binding transcriptional regulator [Acuticoccus mangrovi]MBJ3776359.1 LacI family DNA-binding transcriptional regulator [Acuticoccus mangrovi]